MFAIETFQKYVEQARGARELGAFPRATRAINEADDPLSPEGAEAHRVVAALEAIFLVLAPGGEIDDETEPAFRRVLDTLTGGELDEEQAEDLVDGLAESLEEEGLDIRLKSVAECLHEDPSLAEQAFELCAAALKAMGTDLGDAEALLTDFAEHLALAEDRADSLRSRVDAALT